MNRVDVLSVRPTPNSFFELRTLGRQHKGCEPLLREGGNRSYLPVAGDEIVKFLTMRGLKNVVKTLPQDTEIYAKVIVITYLGILDPDSRR